MPIAIVTGSGGLIGSEPVSHFVRQGLDVVGLDNDMRAYFFGSQASTKPTTERLSMELGASFSLHADPKPGAVCNLGGVE